MEFRLRALKLLAATLVSLPILCQAQSSNPVTPEDEYMQLIKTAQTISPLGPHPFGEHINLYDGTLSFAVTDISVPGTGPALQLGRTFNPTGNESPTVPAQMPFADWDLDIPRIETYTADEANVTGWFVANYGSPGYLNRCTQFGPPPMVTPNYSDSFAADEYWYGYHLIIPGEGSQELLGRGTAGHSPTSGSYPIVTKRDWMISCGVTASDEGEGFVALAPDGTRYTFTQLVYRGLAPIEMPFDTQPYTSPAGSVKPLDTNPSFLARREAMMYVTKIEDRFGNTLTYNWSGSNLTSIVGSDGRKVSLTYFTPPVPNPTGQLIQTITIETTDTPARTWTYDYAYPGNVPTLTSVQLPDGSAWSYQAGTLVTGIISVRGADCNTDRPPVEVLGGGTGSMTTPSGLTATFTLTAIEHGRSYVPKQCIQPPGMDSSWAAIPDLYTVASLSKEVISGPGIPTETWNYSYSTPTPSFTTDSCASNQSCSTTVYTDVTDPLGRTTRSTFSNRFDATEGLLLSTVDYSGAVGSTTIRSTTNTYANPTGGPWPASYGVDPQDHDNNLQVTELSPLQTRIISQVGDGATFTTQINAFDNFARATSTAESSCLSGSSCPTYSKKDTTSYYDNSALWVLGKISSTSTLATAVPCTTSTATNTALTTCNIYDATTALPSSSYSFGRLVSTMAWNGKNTADPGTLASITDGDNHTTTFSSWYRGVPRTITYDYGTSQATTQRATVDGNGWITSVTDENGFTTRYGYDAMGRLASITYPAESGVTWNSTTLSFTPTGNGQYNTPAGAWVQTVQNGNEVTNTFFDAFWRPLVTEHYDAGDKVDTLSQTVTRYDAAGRTIFTSYPTNNVQDFTTANIGTHTTYDALNRVIEVDQNWDLDSSGLLATKTTYLPGFKTEVTLPNGVNTATTTSYKVFGEPTRQWPVSITAPEGEITTIDRDVFGKPTSIARAGSPSQPRSFAYNAYQQLCGRTEPETGTTMYGYDGAGNLKWNVPGLPSTAGCYTDNQAQNSGRMVSRTYDGRNRLTGITYPDGLSTTTYQYAPDGALLVQSVANDSFPVTTYYSYDERRLLTSEKLCFSAPPCASNAPTFVLGYGYDANGHLSSTTYPDGRGISYAPNALGQPTAAGSYATGVKYFPNGTIASFNYGSGAKYTASEDERGLVSRDADALNGAAAMDFSYDYDPDGNVAAITDYLSGNLGNVDMTYDGLDRLKEADSPMFGGTVANPGKALYGYDVFDNLTSASVGNQSLFNYVYNYAQDQLAKLTDPSSGTPLVTYAYDAQGNLAQKNSQVYKFDMANRLMSVPGLATYRYDAAGRRVQKVETEAGKTLDSDYSRAGNLMYQWNPATVDSTDYIYLGSTLVSRVVGNNSVVTGNVDGVTSGDNAVVSGWACSTGITTPISVEVFVGNTPQHGGTSIATVTANQPSNSTVASACHTQGTNYGFSVPLSSAVRSQYPNEPIIVFGFPSNGDPGVELQGSGQYTVPTNPTAPAAPASVTVPASSSTGSFTVSWTASSGATSYVLQRFNENLPDGSWTQVYSGPATSFDETGLGDAIYTYRVQACNSAGCSTFTGSSQVVVAPAPPASISVPASSYSPSLGVTWSASAGAASYALQESFNGGAWANVYSGGATSATVTVAATGTYRFQVAACAGLTCSSYTASSNVAVTLPPTSAPSLSGPSSSASGTYTLSWNTVSGATRYQLNQNLNGTVTTPYNANGMSWSSSALGNGTYNYQVYACNVSGCGPGSNGVAVTVLHVPAAPASISVPASAYLPSFGVSWSATATATNYVLEESFNGGGWGVAYSGAATSTTVTVSNSGTYRFQVAACNASGCGGFKTSGNVSVTPPPAATTSIQACFEPAGICGAVSTTSSASVSGTGAKSGTSGGNFHGSILYKGVQQSFTVTCSAPAGDEGCTNSENLTVGGVVFTFHVSAAWMTLTDCKGLAVSASTSASTASASAPAPALASCPWSANGNITDSSGVPIN